MRHKLPPLNALRAFEVTGRTGSLSAASRELRVSVGAISRHINILEDFVGYRLFTRHHNGMTLTQWGNAYHEQIASAFNQIDAAGRRLQMDDRRTIRLRAYTSFSTEWLTPRLPDFRRKHPDIILKLQQSLSETDFSHEPFDAAISALPVVQRGIASIDLFNSVFVLVCSDGVARQQAINGDFYSQHAPPILFARREISFWERYFELLNLPPPPFSRGLEFDNLSLTYQAARSGAGVALGQLFLVAEDIEAGRLSLAARTCLQIDLPHRFVYRSGRDAPEEIKTLKGWLTKEAKKTLSAMKSIRNNLDHIERGSDSSTPPD